MDQNKFRIIKDKMLEYLYRDNDGVPSRYADMVEIAMELKCDEETAKNLTLALHADGFIQVLDPWTFDAYMTESGLKYLEGQFIGTARTMKTFESKHPGLTQLGDYKASAGPARTIPGKVILVVDDQPAVIDGMRDILHEMGYVMDFAMDGQSGINKALVIRPSLIFLDVAMPGLEGTSVYDWLRKIPATSEIPVVFVTGSDPEELNARITPGPNTFYLQKPVSMSLMRDTIQRIFQK